MRKATAKGFLDVRNILDRVGNYSFMRILGVNISHNPSICVYENGKVKKFYNEERFILKKNIQLNEPFELFQSIHQKINFKIDTVCYASFGRNRVYNPLSDNDIINTLQKQLNFPNYYFNEREHHLYHAVSSFYFSEFDEAVAIVVDGGGACKFFIPYEEIESIYLINNKKVLPVYKHQTNERASFDAENVVSFESFEYKHGYLNKFSNKLMGGSLFSSTCKKTGFDGDDAGKLMGLASYANCDKKYDLDYDKVNAAQETQQKTFNDTCLLIDRAKGYSKNILLSGGYFLNCSNNFKYVKKYPELNFFVDPIPHDPGTAIGAAIYYDNYKRRI